MYYDISMPIEDGMLSWPSDPEVSLTPAKTVGQNGSNVSLISTGTHLGTHVDAPKHFADQGDPVDRIPLEKLVGEALVIDLTGIDRELIGADDISPHLPEGTTRVLFKTRNTSRNLLTKPFTEDYVALSGKAAEYLADQSIVLVGIDYLSIQKRGQDRTAHTALLDKGIVIIEGLLLTDVPAGHYELIALPLRIAGGDGAPARVVLKTRVQ